MKKIYVVLSMVVVVASALFVSCAQKKDPDLVIAPPKHCIATYEMNSEGEYVFTYASEYKWNSSNFYRGFHQHPQYASNVLLYTITPNAAWSAYIEPEATEYLQFMVLKPGCDDGFIEENFELSDRTSGNRGSNTLKVVVVKVPESGEEMVKCVANIIMQSEETPFLTVNIAPRD